jgi:hypothetical protein
MAKLDSNEVVESYIATLDNLARNASVKFNNEENWAFLYGYTQSDIRHMLESLSLTQKQLNTLNTRLEGYGKHV